MTEQQNSDDLFPETNLYIKFEVVSQTGVAVKFEGPVSLIGLRDWFDRAGMGVATVYDPTGSTLLKCVEGGPNKINAIKMVRQHTLIGLREAKDFIEGTLTLKLDSIIKAKALVKDLETIDAKIVTAHSLDNVPLVVTRA